MKKTLFILITVFAAWLPKLAGQVTFTAETLTTCANTTITVDVTVSNFTDVTGISFPIVWDNDVLNYVNGSILNSLHPNLQAPNGIAGANQANPGEINFSWIDFTPPGVDIPDNEVMFTMEFDVVGTYLPPTSMTLIELTNGSFPSEVLQGGSLTPSPSAFTDGAVTIADNEDPVFNGCPPVVTVNGQMASWTVPTATDNCDGNVTPVLTQGLSSGSTFPAGTTLVEYTATDQAGNNADCSFNVTVASSQLTVVVTNDTLQCNETTASVEVRVFNLNDVGGMQFPVVFDTSMLTFTGGMTPAGFPAFATLNLDSAGVGLIRYSWADFLNANPVMNDSLVFDINFDINNPATFSSTTVSFGSPSFSTIFVDGSNSPIPNNDIIFQNGTILLEDNSPEINDCPMDMSLSNDAGLCERTVNYTLPTVTDDCDMPAPPLVQTSILGEGSVFPIGPTTVTYTATDSKGQVGTCSFVVTISDDENPVAVCPATIPDVELDASGDGILSANVGMGNSTDNCPGVMETSPSLTFTCSDLGVQTVTLTATDGSGNSSTAPCAFNVVDNLAPVAVCPATISDVELDASGNGSLPADIGDGSSTDNCGTATETSPSLSFTCSDLGVQTVTLTATDGSGNSSTAPCAFNVVDNLAPVAVCPATISDVELDASGNGSLPADIGDGSSTDNCGTATETSPSLSFTCSDLGVQTVTLTATDGSGNSSTAPCTFNVVDNLAPVAVCPATISDVELDASGNGALPANVGMGNSTDNCGAVTETSLSATFTCADLGVQTVTLTATDGSGNSSTAPCTFNVVDNVSPMAICQDATIYLDGAGGTTIGALDIDGGSTDNCAVTSASTMPFSFNCSTLGDNSVTLTVGDASGNSDMCTATVTVLDTVPPTVLCQNDTLYLDGIGEANLTPMDIDSGSSDACGIETMTVSQTDFDCTDLGVVSVMLIATDTSGNVDSCMAQVTVLDTIPPSAICQNDTLYLDAAGNAALIPANLDNSSTDNCGVDEVTASQTDFTCADFGDNIVTVYISDASDNLDSCTATVTVLDTIPPSLSCPSDVVVTVPVGTVDTMVNNVSLLSSDDNCGVDTTYFVLTGDLTDEGANDAAGTAFPVGMTNVEYYVVDAAGNIDSCNFNVTVEEVTVLTIACPTDITQANDMGECSASVGGLGVTITGGAAADTSYTLTGATIDMGMGNIPEPSTFIVGTTTVVYTATNTTDTASCSFTVVVQDTLAPVINCPAPLSVANTPGECGLTFSVGFVPAIANDNCGDATIYTSPFNTGDLIPVGGPYDITAIAVDTSGNADTCVYQITVNDTESPVWTDCPSNISNVPSDPGECGAIVSWDEPTVNDNCIVIAITPPTNPNGSLFPAGEMTLVEYVAVDAAGNTAKCSFNVSVVDVEAPTIAMCPSNIIRANDPDSCNAVVTWDVPIEDDNCEVISFVSSGIPTGNIFAVGGPYPISYTATDEAGNTTFCSFQVTVNDAELPQVIGMPADITIPADAGECGAIVNWSTPTAADNCGIQSFEGSNDPGEFFPVTSPGSPHVVNYTATDINGNVTVSEFMITVLDDQLPLFTNCPTSNVIVNVDGTTASPLIGSVNPVDCENIEINLNDLLADDNCGSVTINQTFGPSSGDVFTLGSETLTFVATDVNGNQSTCSFNIVVEGVPVAGAQALSTSPCEGDAVDFFLSNNVPGANYTWTDPTNTVVSNQASFTLPSITAAQSGDFIVDVDLGFCQQSDTVEVQVFENPVISISYNDVLCTDGTVPLILTGTNTSGAIINEWMWTTPATPSTAFGQTLTITDPTEDDAGFYTLQATSDNGCVATVQTADPVIVSEQPPMPALTASPPNICLGESVDLEGEPFAGTNVEYQWSSDPTANSGFPSPIPNNFSIDVQPEEPGTYTYFYTVVSDGCASQMAEVVVQVEADPVVAIGVDGETTCLTGDTDITLSVNQSMGSTIEDYFWTPGNITTPTRLIANATSDSSDIYTVTVSTALGCMGTASVNLTDLTDALATPIITPDNDSICFTTNTTINVFPAYPSGTTYTWAVNGEIQPSSLPAIIVTPDMVGTTEITLVVSLDGCESEVATTQVVALDMGQVDVSVDGQTDCLDGTTTVTLVASADGATTYEWPAQGVMMAELPIMNATSANSGPYTVIARNDVGCVTQATFVLELTDALPPLTAFLESTACDMEDLELCVEPTIPGATYEWTGPLGTVIATTQCPTISNATDVLDGDYTVTAMLEGCVSTAEPLEVDVLMPPTANNEVVVGIVDQPQSYNVVVNDVLEGDYTISVVQDPEFGSVTYDGEGVFTYRPQAGFRETDRMAYEICYEDCPEACDIAIVTLLIRFPGDECIATTLITPNNDGINDEFVVSCLEVQDYPQNTLYIFNEWGDQVFEAAPYDNSWRGTYKNRDLPDGTYFYIFQREPNVPAQKGFVMIHR